MNSLVKTPVKSSNCDAKLGEGKEYSSIKGEIKGGKRV